jgi:hypothetical protein
MPRNGTECCSIAADQKAAWRYIRWFSRTATLCLVILTISCASGGRVLHVDNRETLPYISEDTKLKRRLIRVLARRKLISGAQQYTCQINIMEIGRFYILEVWPDGIKAGGAFGVTLKKPLLIPVGRYTGTR